eukprot:TRINITY_DN3035_c0_g4_i1.p1 TRINITY_DN3035_c0_g4~~TRINITY_DN3035_c0_g4_i1.p1  ORF type:complete len:305 (+),score=93.23 TRINITY_DN3035_c0_g4_i1:536-1450(+)
MSALRNWIACNDTEHLRSLTTVFARGHFFVEVDPAYHETLQKKGAALASQFFADERKRELQIEDGTRTWGWNELPEKRKEMMKVRKVKSCREGWGVGTPPWHEAAEVLGLYEKPAYVIAQAVLLGMGLDAREVEEILEDPEAELSTAKPESEFAASFHEFFKYNHFDFTEDGKVAVPAEEHKDVGLVTVTHASSLGKGLQAYDWEEAQWVCMESRMTASKGGNILGVLFGSCAERICKGRDYEVCVTPHRVVLPNSTSLPPRCSHIFEVLPRPDAVLPLKCGEPMTGAQLFSASSIGVSSINFE